MDISGINNLMYKYSLNRIYKPTLTVNYNCLDTKCEGRLRIKYKYLDNDIRQITIEKMN